MHDYKIYSLAAIAATQLLIGFSEKYEEAAVHDKDSFYQKNFQESEEFFNLRKEILLGEGSKTEALIADLCKQILLNHCENGTAHMVMMIVPVWDADCWAFESTLIEEVQV